MLLYRVTLTDGSTRTFEYRPEVGMAGELNCQVDIEIVDGLVSRVEPEDVVFAPHRWSQFEAIAEVEEGS